METKSYKNINVNDLDLRARIDVTAKKVALLVPKLLAKMAKALVVNPITKLVSGQTYEQVKAEAVRGALEDQKEQADELGEKIVEGRANLEEWKNDEEYYTSNIAKYKAYESTIERLEKRQNKLLTVPKKILVAKNYLMAMMAFKKHRKQQKANEKVVKQIVEEYKRRQEEIAKKELEVEALKQALRKSELNLQTLKDETKEFEKENAAVIASSVEEDKKVTTEEPLSPEVKHHTEEEPISHTIAAEAFKKAAESNVNPEPEATELTEQEPDNVVEAVGDVVVPTEEVRVEETVQTGMPKLELSEIEVTGIPQPNLFAQMTNMANMQPAPVSDDDTLQSFGLSQEGTQKSL